MSLRFPAENNHDGERKRKLKGETATQFDYHAYDRFFPHRAPRAPT